MSFESVSFNREDDKGPNVSCRVWVGQTDKQQEEKRRGESIFVASGDMVLQAAVGWRLYNILEGKKG